MAGLTNRERLQLAFPLLAIGATIATFAIAGVIGDPRPAKAPPAPPPPKAQQVPSTTLVAPIGGLTRISQATVLTWIDSFNNLTEHELSPGQRITGAGRTADNRWGYLATTATREGDLAGRYVLYRSDTYGWQVVGVTDGAKRIRDCDRTDPPPASFARQLQRDRFVCGYVQ